MLDFVIKVNKKYYSQTLLGECKYEVKRPKWRVLLMMNQKLIRTLSDDERDSNSDNETESDYDNEFKKSDNTFDYESAE